MPKQPGDHQKALAMGIISQSNLAIREEIHLCPALGCRGHSTNSLSLHQGISEHSFRHQPPRKAFPLVSCSSPIPYRS